MRAFLRQRVHPCPPALERTTAATSIPPRRPGIGGTSGASVSSWRLTDEAAFPWIPHLCCKVYNKWTDVSICGTPATCVVGREFLIADEIVRL
jgi:hypothetical protein